MSCKITIRNPGSHFRNPLLKLANETYATREEALEAIYSAMYDVINSEGGCEMVDKSPALEDDVGDAYISRCREYIMREGYACEDGVSASVEEVES